MKEVKNNDKAIPANTQSMLDATKVCKTKPSNIYLVTGMPFSEVERMHDELVNRTDKPKGLAVVNLEDFTSSRAEDGITRLVCGNPHYFDIDMESFTAHAVLQEINEDSILAQNAIVFFGLGENLTEVRAKYEFRAVFNIGIDRDKFADVLLHTLKMGKARNLPSDRALFAKVRNAGGDFASYISEVRAEQKLLSSDFIQLSSVDNLLEIIGNYSDIGEK